MQETLNKHVKKNNQIADIRLKVSYAIKITCCLIGVLCLGYLNYNGITTTDKYLNCILIANAFVAFCYLFFGTSFLQTRLIILYIILIIYGISITGSINESIAPHSFVEIECFFNYFYYCLIFIGFGGIPLIIQYYAHEIKLIDKLSQYIFNHFF
jgi:hypothetical protein